MLCRRISSSFTRQKLVFTSPVSGSHTCLQPTNDVKENLTSDGNEETSTNLPLLETPLKKERKVKHAMLLCYHGANYNGMQFNLNCPSIESELFKALALAGLVPEDEARNARFDVGFNRASRTDSGVSALRQVVSIKLPLSTNIEDINKHLPLDIRVLGLKRSTKAFDAQLDCYSRSYCYIMPTYGLCAYKDLHAPKENYRIPAETLLLANEIFRSYVGSHKFHNYTEKRDCWDQRARRTIIDASFSEPFLFNDLEMVELHLTGHSFMLHQIRRMVGMTIALMSGRVPFHYLRLSLENQKLPAPTAPALGLMLEKQYFDYYNKRFGHIREPVEWNELDHEVEKFKLERIVPWIVKTERDEDSMGMFLSEKLKRHSFSVTGHKEVKMVKLGNWEDLEAVDKLLADETLQTEK